MANGIAYVKTATGKTEVAASPGKLPIGLKTLLGLVDNSTVAQLQGKLPQVPLDKLNAALDRLFVDGYIEIAVAAAAGAPAKPDAGLDFANFINRPVKEPTFQQLQQAEVTLSGIKASKKAGYFVHIINRAAIEQEFYPDTISSDLSSGGRQGWSRTSRRRSPSS